MRTTKSAQFKSALCKKLATLRPGAKLPSDRILARKFGMSSRTVRTVLAGLSADGLVERSQGKGTFLPGRDQFEPPLISSLSSAQSLSRQLSDAITRGEFKAGEQLPKRAFVSDRFGVSPSIVTQAYGLLAKDGQVSRIGNRYWVGSLRSLTTGNSKSDIWLFHKGSDKLEVIQKQSFIGPSMNKLESELSHYGYRFRSIAFESLRRTFLDWSRHNYCPAGMIFTGQNDPEFLPTFIPRISKFLASQNQSDTPVLLSDGNFTSLPSNMLCLSKGHSVTGLVRNLAQYIIANTSGEVVLFFDERHPSHLDSVNTGFGSIARIVPELLKLRSDCPIKIIALPATNTQTPKDFVDRQIRLGMQLAPLSKYSNVTAEQVAGLVTLIESFAKAFRTLTHKGIWVFRNDSVAIEAQTYAKRRKIAIPRELSLISSENSPESFRHGIATFVPDWDQIGYIAAHALIGDIRIQRSTRGYIHSASMILPRFTCP